MKANELRPCDKCGDGLGMVCYKVSIEQHLVDMAAARRSDGLSMMLGSTVLARAMGPDEDVTNQVGVATDKLLCQECMLTVSLGRC